MVVKVACDVESTGLAINDPKGPRPDGIIQVGIAWRDSKGVLCHNKFECDPGAEFYADGRADAAFKVNGYSVERISGLPPAQQIAEVLIARLNDIRAPLDGLVLNAYNNPFDHWFLSQPPWLLTEDLGYPWAPDLMIRAAKAAGVPAGENGHRFSLDAAMKFAGLERFGTAHDAESDAVDALMLWEWLDQRDANEANHEITSLEDLTGQLNKRLADASPPGFPKAQPAAKPGTVSPSDLWMCPRAYWRRFHGVPRSEDRFFREIKGPMGEFFERLALDRYERAGVRVLRGEYIGDGVFSGKLDGRIEWPPASGRWIIVECKSVWNEKTLQNALTYPSNAWMDQIEVYLRCTGIDTAILEVFKLGDPEDEASWENGRRPFRPDDRRWAALQEQASRFLELQRPETLEPDCRCWRCKKEGLMNGSRAQKTLESLA